MHRDSEHLCVYLVKRQSLKGTQVNRTSESTQEAGRPGWLGDSGHQDGMQTEAQSPRLRSSRVHGLWGSPRGLAQERESRKREQLLVIANKAQLPKGTIRSPFTGPRWPGFSSAAVLGELGFWPRRGARAANMTTLMDAVHSYFLSPEAAEDMVQPAALRASGSGLGPESSVKDQCPRGSVWAPSAPGTPGNQCRKALQENFKKSLWCLILQPYP